MKFFLSQTQHMNKLSYAAASQKKDGSKQKPTELKPTAPKPVAPKTTEPKPQESNPVPAKPIEVTPVVKTKAWQGNIPPALKAVNTNRMYKFI
jgi:hypothetical protein